MSSLATILNIPELSTPKAVAVKKGNSHSVSYKELIATFVLKQRASFDSWSPYLFNKLISSQMYFLGLASKLDKYVFKVDPSIMYGLYMYCIPKLDKAPLFTYAKGKATEEFTEYEEEVRTMLQMTEKELRLTRHLL